MGRGSGRACVQGMDERGSILLLWIVVVVAPVAKPAITCLCDSVVERLHNNAANIVPPQGQPKPKEFAMCHAMKRTGLRPLFAGLLALWVGCGLGVADAARAANGVAIVGKNDWLFVRHEMVQESLSSQAQASFRLIGQLNRMLAQRGVALAVTIVPSKMETYAEHLPDDFRVSDYMKGFNDAAHLALRAHGVATIDLKKSLREAALQDIGNPLFFRLDTHWTPSGALVAAKTVQASMVDHPGLKAALDSVPQEDYQLTWAKKNLRQSNMRDITKFLDANAPVYPPEVYRRFVVARANPSDTSLLGDRPGGEIALVGSSFSGDWTGFPDAMRFALQRPVLNFSINADAGPWAVVRGYLADDVFQMGQPKLIIWEIPERSIGLGPNYPFRLERYKMSSSDWVLQVAALSEPDCQATSVGVVVGSSGRGNALGSQDQVSTHSGDFVDVEFDKPVDASAYLSASLLSHGTKQIEVEAFNRSTLVRKFKLEMPGDERAHALKTPVSLGAGSVTRLRFYPGETHAFSLKTLKVCRYRENWLKNMPEV